MKNLSLIVICLISLTISAKLKLNQDSPASAIWYQKTKIRLNLPNNLNVNETIFYSLVNSSMGKEIKLFPNISHDRVVEFNINNLSKN